MADFKDTFNPQDRFLKNFFPLCLGPCVTGSLFDSGTRIQKDSLCVCYQSPLFREPRHSPGSCVRFTLSGPRMVPPPPDKEQMHINLPQAEIRVLFFNVIKELKNNVISLSQLSTLLAILEMWGLKEVLPVLFLSFSLTLMWLSKFLM